MLKTNYSRVVIVMAGIAACGNALAEPGGKGKKGGQGGGESAIRMCVDFNDDLGTALCGAAPCPANAISDGLSNEELGFQYCDGFDGEHLVGIEENGGIKIMTDQRDSAPVNRTVRFTVNAIQSTPQDCDIDVGALRDAIWTRENFEAFFGWAKSEFVPPDGTCEPTDPFDPNVVFTQSTLDCLENSGTTLDVMSMRPDDETPTRYMSWEMRLFDPVESIKKSGKAFRVMYGNSGCAAAKGRPGTLPVAVRCVTAEADECTQWRVKTFRGCIQDYRTTRGGNWNDAFSGCGIDTEVWMTRKPE
jgi:hypothetical protein